MALTAFDPSRDSLTALLQKYETLAALRRDRAEGKPLPPASRFKALAASFPGALRELDTLPLEVIEERVVSIRRAVEGAPMDPWIPWMLGYHALGRAAIRIRIGAAGQRDIADDRANELAEDASSHAGIPVDVAFVRSVLSPPGGRIFAVVLSRLGDVFGERVEVLRRALLTRPRASKSEQP